MFLGRVHEWCLTFCYSQLLGICSFPSRVRSGVLVHATLLVNLGTRRTRPQTEAIKGPWMHLRLSPCLFWKYCSMSCWSKRTNSISTPLIDRRLSLVHYYPALFGNIGGCCVGARDLACVSDVLEWTQQASSSSQSATSLQFPVKGLIVTLIVVHASQSWDQEKSRSSFSKGP